MLNGKYVPLTTNGQPIQVELGPMGAEKGILAIDTLRDNQVVVLTESDVANLRTSGRWDF